MSLDIWDLDSFMLTDELFSKAIQRLAAYFSSIIDYDIFETCKLCPWFSDWFLFNSFDTWHAHEFIYCKILLF